MTKFPATQAEALVAQTRRYLWDPGLWPAWPTLWLKRYPAPGRPHMEFGIIVDSTETRLKVFRVFDPDTYSPSNPDALDQATVYRGVDAVIADDWVLD